jgi:S1-C subfamily serine protease
MKAKKKSRPAVGTAGTGTPTGVSRRQVFADIRRSVVAIVKGPPLVAGQPIDLKQIVIAGSGFFVDKTGWLVTAGHVVDGWVAALQQGQANNQAPDLPQILYHGPSTQIGAQTTWGYFLSTVIGIYRPQDCDIAVLQTAPTGEALKAINAVRFASSPCAEGDHVATCGYPFGVELHAQIVGGLVTIVPSFSQGIVSAILPHFAVPPVAMKRFQIHAMISGGNSGGPVFDPYSGKVIGMITDSIREEAKGVVVRQAPKNAAGAPIGAPVEKTIDLAFPVGLALAEHAHHVIKAIADARVAVVKPAAP